MPAAPTAKPPSASHGDGELIIIVVSVVAAPLLLCLISLLAVRLYYKYRRLARRKGGVATEVAATETVGGQQQQQQQQPVAVGVLLHDYGEIAPSEATLPIAPGHMPVHRPKNAKERGQPCERWFN